MVEVLLDVVEVNAARTKMKQEALQHKQSLPRTQSTVECCKSPCDNYPKYMGGGCMTLTISWTGALLINYLINNSLCGCMTFPHIPRPIGQRGGIIIKATAIITSCYCSSQKGCSSVQLWLWTDPLWHDIHAAPCYPYKHGSPILNIREHAAKSCHSGIYSRTMTQTIGNATWLCGINWTWFLLCCLFCWKSFLWVQFSQPLCTLLRAQTQITCHTHGTGKHVRRECWCKQKSRNKCLLGCWMSLEAFIATLRASQFSAQVYFQSCPCVSHQNDTHTHTNGNKKK